MSTFTVIRLNDVGSSVGERSNRIVGPLLMTVGLRADSNVAQCVPIPTRAHSIYFFECSGVGFDAIVGFDETLAVAKIESA